MLKVNNATPLEVQLFQSTDKNCLTYAVVVMKGTFDFGQSDSGLILSPQSVPICQGDEFYGEPGVSSVKYESDLAPLKLATDVVLIGDAVYNSERPVRCLDVSLTVDKARRVARVFGRRGWESRRAIWEASQPDEFVRMPLTYENAFGGTLAQNELAEPEQIFQMNSVGKGFIPDKLRSKDEEVELPNIEDPRQLIRSPDDKPEPAGFGFVGRSWEPRIKYTGTYDEQWSKERMPMLPLDFDDKFYNGASSNLIFPFLTGGEKVSITNVHPEGELAFFLPKVNVSVKVKVRGKSTTYKANMDTVVIEPNEGRVQVTWRVVAPCFRQFLYVDTVDVLPLEWL